MATEEQTTYDGVHVGISTNTSFGQKLTISNRIMSKLSFVLGRVGTISGTTTFVIRKVSTDAIIMQKLWGNSTDIAVGAAWYEVEFDTPTLINEEVYILVTCSYGVASHVIQGYAAYSDVAADKVVVSRSTSGVYSETAGRDAAYKYTYIEPGVGVFPSEAITRVTNLIHRYNRAEGDYTLEMALGEVTSDFGLPEWLSRPRASIPETAARRDIEEFAKSPKTSKQIFRTVDEAITAAWRQQAELPVVEEPSPVPTGPDLALTGILGDLFRRLFRRNR